MAAAVAPGSQAMCLLTATGGHIGWPTGWLPWQSNWAWSSAIALDFIETVHATHDAGATVSPEPNLPLAERQTKGKAGKAD